MKDILTGIQTHWVSSILPPFCGALYVGNAPQGTTDDYTTLTVVAHERDWTMDTKFARPVLQFSLWSLETSLYDLLANADLITDVFDNAAVTITSATTIRMDRVAGPLPIADPDGGWQITMDYQMLVEEAD